MICCLQIVLLATPNLLKDLMYSLCFQQKMSNSHIVLKCLEQLGSLEDK